VVASNYHKLKLKDF